MATSSSRAVAVLVVVVRAVLVARAGASVVEDGCLSCLCQAATGCGAGTAGAASGACGRHSCGMFAISRRYWEDAGSPAGDFETCALDPACATQCVRLYMHKYGKDCDGDGTVGCADLYRLHRLGREGCGRAGRTTATFDAEFSSRLAACNTSIPLGDLYARAAAIRHPRQGGSWNGGSGPGGSAAYFPSPPSPSSGGARGSSLPSSPSSFGGRQGQGGGGSPALAFGRGPSLSLGSFSPSVGYSQALTVNNPGYSPGYQPNGGQGSGRSGGGYRSTASSPAGATNGYLTASGYRTGYLEGYEEGYGYRGSSGYPRAGYAGYTGYRGPLWGAGESGGYSGVARYRDYGGSTSSRAGGGLSAAVSTACLACICNALTGCDPGAGCAAGGCGPFRISRSYWQDCGAPGGSYEFCTRDYGCSSTCARAYLSKYSQDCNGDGVVDCRDYSRIHRLGGFGCRGALDEPYRSYVDACSN